MPKAPNYGRVPYAPYAPYKTQTITLKKWWESIWPFSIYRDLRLQQQLVDSLRKQHLEAVNHYTKVFEQVGRDITTSNEKIAASSRADVDLLQATVAGLVMALNLKKADPSDPVPPEIPGLDLPDRSREIEAALNGQTGLLRGPATYYKGTGEYVK